MCARAFTVQGRSNRLKRSENSGRPPLTPGSILTRPRAAEKQAPDIRECSVKRGENETLPPLAEGQPGTIDGWDDLLEEARTGIVRFEGGDLRIEPTAAMTMIDVDGWLVPDKLAQMAAWAAARAIRRLDLGGSTGIDFPTLRDKAARAEADTILESYLARPFERTAMNGFGFVQIVRPRRRASLIELAQERAAFESRALLRRVAFEPPGPKRLVTHPAVGAVLEKQAGWLDALARQVGGAVGLRADPTLPMSGGYAEPA